MKKLLSIGFVVLISVVALMAGATTPTVGHVEAQGDSYAFVRITTEGGEYNCRLLPYPYQQEGAYNFRYGYFVGNSEYSTMLSWDCIIPMMAVNAEVFIDGRTANCPPVFVPAYPRESGCIF